jgi:hypothetical protein
MFSIIGATLVYTLAIYGAYKLLTKRLHEMGERAKSRG